MNEAIGSRWGRRSLALALTSIIVFAVSSVAVAGAATARLDRAYGQGGVVEVDPPELVTGDPRWVENVEEIETARDGSAFVHVRAQSCTDKCVAFDAVFRYRKNGSLDRGFGGNGYFRTPVGGIGPVELTVDSRGRPVLTGIARHTRVVLRRLTSRGFLDRGFGRRGVARFKCECGGGVASMHTRFVAGPGGGGTVVIAMPWWKSGPSSTAELPGTTFQTLRVRSDGSRLRGYGEGGIADFSLPEIAWEGWSGMAEALPGGGIYLAARTEERSEEEISFRLARVSARGRVDTRFAASAKAALETLPRRFTEGSSFSIGAFSLRSGGKIDLFGRIWGAGKGFMLRVRPDGHMFKEFAGRGLRDLPAGPVAVARGSEGATLALLGPSYSPERLLRILPGGRLDPRFGREGTAITERLSGGGFSLGSLSGRRFALATLGSHECRESCPPTPALARYLEPPRRKR